MINAEPAGEDFPPPNETWPNSSTNPSTGTSYTQGWIESKRSGFIELILQQVYLAITNTFPGLDSAFDALKYWAENLLPDMIKNPLNLLVQLLVDVLDSIPFIGDPLTYAAGAFRIHFAKFAAIALPVRVVRYLIVILFFL